MVTYIHTYMYIYYIPWIQCYSDMTIQCGVSHKNRKRKCTVQLKLSYKKNMTHKMETMDGIGKHE
jgi:hypothetical protein